jgi:hypothetical protein
MGPHDEARVTDAVHLSGIVQHLVASRATVLLGISPTRAGLFVNAPVTYWAVRPFVRSAFVSLFTLLH